MRWAIVAIGIAAGASGAQAQSLTFAPYNGNGGPVSPDTLRNVPVNLGTDYLQLTRCPNGIGTGACVGVGSVTIGQVYEAIPRQGADPATSAALVAIAGRLDRLADRFREGIALAGAINVLPPNPGDRFAVSFGGAGYDGAGAGSVSISARINDDTLAYVGYARGPTQNLVKGGVGFSFR